MAALEKMTKKDLVALTRELRAETKLLRKELEDLKAGELDEKTLPLYAGTYYNNGGKFTVDVLKYSPESNNVKVVDRIEESTKELALYKLEMVIAEKIEAQEL